MWKKTFEERHISWVELRNSCAELSATEVLDKVAAWWHHAPWQPYYLHWDDQATWPDPWQLLADNIYCDVAKPLGIVYTLTMINHQDFDMVELVLTEDDYNLVWVNGGKYTINMSPRPEVNTDSQAKIKRKISSSEFLKYK